ncbi:MULTISPECIES: acyltransferase family protein [Sphingomonas]|uniref:Acyltransferase 3 domain-containing protein n=1 Tax=Sphingomonas molluscorum TaxID=418184 RepID=A0ABU8Q5P0_9SPHN|nr:hypothetical protein [Sphingomonas sp. JUb134]MBM7406599.1 peptidoglycan/LPS O-acetylase OafA/YrhL [Sphingomonas sp. JUb134]
MIAAAVLRYAPAAWHRYGKVALGVGLLMLVASAVYIQNVDYTTDLFARTLLFNVVSIGAMLCLPSVRALRRPKSPVVVWVITMTSVLSYSAYLCHWMILMALEMVQRHLPGTLVIAALLSCVFVGSVIVVSALSYMLVEVPFLRLRDRLSRPEAHQI